MSRAFVCLLLLSAIVSGQGSATFEVASIRPSSEQVAQVSAGMRIAGSQVRLTAMSLKEYIVIAYGVKPQQIVGPDWLGQTRFDLAATIPAGGSAAQVPEMLRALLADRFQMTMHRETREFPVYALGVAKGGAKIQPSKAPAPTTETTGEKPPAVDVTARGSSAGTTVDLGRGSTFTFGNNRLEVGKMTMTSFAEVLTRFVDRAVLNETGLTGEYDVVLNIAPEDYMPLMVRSGVNAGVALPPQALRLLDGANTDPLSGPLRDVGLTLESRKAPLSVVVVDAISKTPTEN
jgi:uncharacterized protein (TIGR03435 family)